jgi:hypothetical protein
MWPFVSTNMAVYQIPISWIIDLKVHFIWKQKSLRSFCSSLLSRHMNQVLQHLKTGQTEVADVPAPLVRPGHLLIATRRARAMGQAARAYVVAHFNRRQQATQFVELVQQLASHA